MWSYIFAGIGMIFIGGQFLSFGVKQAAGTRLRAVFTTATKGRWRTVVIGTLAGALLQSTNAVSFMASSLVGAGSLAPKLAKISPNTGTTLTKRKIVMRIATTVTTVGYIMADLTFLRSRAAFSR